MNTYPKYPGEDTVAMLKDAAFVRHADKFKSYVKCGECRSQYLYMWSLIEQTIDCLKAGKEVEDEVGDVRNIRQTTKQSTKAKDQITS